MESVKKIPTPKDRELQQIVDRLNQVIHRINGIKVVRYGDKDYRLEIDSDAGKITTVVDTFEFNK